jgi:dihydrofolate reductase
MRKLVVTTFVTLDGVMQGPGGPNEDQSNGFEHGGWNATLWDDGMGEIMDGQLNQAEALLLGRKTYEIFAAHWPRMPEDDPVAAKLNGMPKYVASTTLDTAEWQNSTLLKGKVPDEVAKLKDQPGGDIQVIGSGNLIQTLLKHDLVDEFVLWVWPVLLGEGKRLFADGTIPKALKLVDTKVSSTGVAVQTYQTAGTPEYGSFALEDQ